MKIDDTTNKKALKALSSIQQEAKSNGTSELFLYEIKLEINTKLVTVNIKHYPISKIVVIPKEMLDIIQSKI